MYLRIIKLYNLTANFLSELNNKIENLRKSCPICTQTNYTWTSVSVTWVICFIQSIKIVYIQFWLWSFYTQQLWFSKEKDKCIPGILVLALVIPLETAAIFFLANLFPKQGISSEYVTADFICMGLLGLQGAKTENYKMKNSCPYRDSNSRPLILKSSALSMRLSSLIYKR